MREPVSTSKTDPARVSSDLPHTAQESTEMPTVDSAKPKARRGFAAMNPERRREIARKGGASVPSEKRSFAKDRDLAANAGRKGGEASRGGGRTRGTGPKETWEV